MLDFVQPSTDKCQFFRPSFAFGIFGLSRINKKCSILFDPVQIDLYQLSRPSFAFGIFRLSRLNKKKFDNVQPSSDILQLSRPSFGFGVF